MLKAYSDAEVVLPMPSGVTVQKLTWVSVWCRQYAIDFGSMVVDSSKFPGERERENLERGGLYGVQKMSFDGF